MKIPAGKVTRLTGYNIDRNYLAIQNMSNVATEILYVLQEEAEPEVFINNGLCIGGYGEREMQNCVNPKSKKAWYGYTDVVGGLDIRIMDI